MIFKDQMDTTKYYQWIPKIIKNTCNLGGSTVVLPWFYRGSTVVLPFFADPSPARRAVGPGRALAIAPLCGDFSGLAKLSEGFTNRMCHCG